MNILNQVYSIIRKVKDKHLLMKKKKGEVLKLEAQ